MQPEITPPKLFARFFKWFCKPDLYEELQGDLEENFYRTLDKKGHVIANRYFRKEVLKLFRPSVIRRFAWPKILPNRILMQSYLRIAIRDLRSNSAYALGNIFGLTVGITACLLIFLYIWKEWKYDQHHEQIQQIYRLNSTLEFPDQKMELALAAGPVAPALQAVFPEVKTYTRLSVSRSPKVISKGDKRFFEEGVIYVDSTFFQLFDFRVLHGKTKDALTAPYTVVLSKGIAQKYFSKENVVGEELIIDGQNYQITAVMENLPDNSHLQASLLISFSTWTQERPPTNTNWTWTSFPTYILLDEQANAENFKAKIASFYKDNLPENNESDLKITLSLEPFSNIHFSSSKLGDLQPKGNRKYLGFLALSALFILIMAVLNFVNLSTAKGMNRSKEIGVRKTIGAYKSQIISQFITETLVMVLLAFLFVLLTLRLVLPYFSQLLDRNFDLGLFLSIPGLLLLLLFAIGLSLLAGSYPAFFVASFKPVINLKSRGGLKLGKVHFWKYLSGIQFAISIGLIICTLVVWQQLNYMLNQDLGFDKEQKLVMNFGGDHGIRNQYTSIKQELLKIPEVESVAFSSHIPFETAHGVSTSIRMEDGKFREFEMELGLVDHDFLDTYGLKLLAGRKFSAEFSQDTLDGLILNASAVKQFGFSTPNAILGQEFHQWEGHGRVIGVVEDFNSKSLQNEIGAYTFQVQPHQFEKLTIKYRNSNQLPETLEKIGNTWQRVAGNLPFTYEFLDERLALQYSADRRIANLSTVFSLLAIIIASLGLIGLIAYTCRRKAKDLAVKRVMGASTSQLIWSLFQEFGKPILWAWVIVLLPIYLLLNKWLEDFAYRIEVNWLLLVLVGFVMLGFSYLVVSLQSFRTVNANPVKYLKEE